MITQAENVFQAKRQMDLVLSGQVFMMFTPGLTQEYRDAAVAKFEAKAIRLYDEALQNAKVA